MERFFGMMPSSEIEIEKGYTDCLNFRILIQAGCHGWSVLWGDRSSNYRDEEAHN